MSEKRLVVDEDYNWVDTETGYCIEMEDAFELVNQLWEENEELRTRLNNIKIYVEFQLQEVENDLKTSIKGGMPTGSLYEEINLLKDIQMVIYNVWN